MPQSHNPDSNSDKYLNRNQDPKNKHKEKFEPLPDDFERIGKLIVDAAYSVHYNLGPGLLEKIYELCFCHELKKRGLSYERQVNVPIIYDNLKFDEGLRLDVLVEGQIICELKALENVNPVWEAQLLSHLRLLDSRLGYLINFNVPRIKNGIRRYIL
ncbi:MAG: GxxExxY protein [Bacteroidales bacterium]